MTRRPSSRFLLIAAHLIALALAVATPARASVSADFNGDGVLDAVVNPQTTDGRLLVRVSGLGIQTLRLHDRVLLIVATDIDRDGHPDLSIVLARRGLSVWLNAGGRGHFKAARRKFTPRGPGVGRSGPSVTPHEVTGYDTDLSATPDDLRAFDVVSALPIPQSRLTARLKTAENFRWITVILRGRPTRAPPLAV